MMDLRYKGCWFLAEGREEEIIKRYGIQMAKAHHDIESSLQGGIL